MLELNKEKNAVAMLQEGTKRLKKQLERLEKEKEKKRKESVATEPAPPAKRAARSGRRSAPQSTSVSRKRQEVSFDLCYLFHNLVT